MSVEVAGGGPRTAVVLTGGGARAAYQAGVLCGLGRRMPELRFPIVTGVSAGAINATFLAGHPGPLGDAAEALRELWCGISFADVFRVEARSLARNVARWGATLVAGGASRSELRGLVDTAPLRRFLERGYRAGPDGLVEGVAENLARGHLQALAVSAVNYGTGQTVTWVDGADIRTWERPSRRSRRARIRVDHVMASAALPLVFPAVEVDGAWYGDGGIRAAAPLSPALHLGADRILAVSTRYARSVEEADRPVIRGYPPPAQILGNLMNAIFLDVLDQDVRRLERANVLLRQLPPEHRGGLRPVDVVFLRPSRDLGRLTAPHEVDLPRAFRFLTRALGTRETDSPDFLSLLMFDPDYVREIFAIGVADAEASHDAIAAILEPGGAGGAPQAREQIAAAPG